MMIPSRFFERMASSEESTIAASRNREADARLFDSPRAIMQAEKHKNPSIPKNWVRSLKAKECAGGKNQNHTPSVVLVLAASALLCLQRSDPVFRDAGILVL